MKDIRARLEESEIMKDGDDVVRVQGDTAQLRLREGDDLSTRAGKINSTSKWEFKHSIREFTGEYEGRTILVMEYNRLPKITPPSGAPSLAFLIMALPIGAGVLVGEALNSHAVAIAVGFVVLALEWAIVLKLSDKHDL